MDKTYNSSTVPSTQVYKWVSANLIQKGNPGVKLWEGEEAVLSVLFYSNRDLFET